MSEIIANLDAAIADYRANNEGVARSIVIFGREWDLVPELTTVTADALARCAALADGVESGDGRQAMAALSGLNSILPSTINEEERHEFEREWARHSVPLGALELIIEAVMEAFNPAPFSPAPTMASGSAALTPEHSSGSGNGPTPSGLKSNQPSLQGQTPLGHAQPDALSQPVTDATVPGSWAARHQEQQGATSAAS